MYHKNCPLADRRWWAHYLASSTMLPAWRRPEAHVRLARCLSRFRDRPGTGHAASLGGGAR